MPAGYSLLVQPEEYQARNVHADSVTVLLLCDFTTTQPGHRARRPGSRVFPVQMTWAQADWKVASFGAGGDAALAAEPFSAQAASLGWQELLPAGERRMTAANCLLDPLGCLTSAAGSGASDAATTAWDSICKSFADAAAELLKAFGQAFAALPSREPGDGRDQLHLRDHPWPSRPSWRRCWSSPG